MRPAIVSGIVSGDAPVSYWPFFPLSLVTIPEVFKKVTVGQVFFLFFKVTNANSKQPIRTNHSFVTGVF